MGHEDTVLSQLIAFAMLGLGVYHFIKGYRHGPAIDLDNIEIFRVEPIQAVQPIAATVKATVQPQSEVQSNHNGYTELQQDCFDSLKTLGIKGVRERKFIVSETFNKHSPTTVQEFLKYALGK